MDYKDLELFLADATLRFSRIAAAGSSSNIPMAFRPAAESVSRQAGGDWKIETRPGDGFSISSALRKFSIGEDFDTQCKDVCKVVASSQVPQLRALVAKMQDTNATILAAFFNYFVVHELLHVEQGLGSDQYKDSDLYMPIVMEADHVADVVGLAIALDIEIPELTGFDRHEKMLLFIAIHIAAMQSFCDPNELDAYSFARLLVWYVHFARFAKCAGCPDLDTPAMLHPWIISLPRLIGREDHQISIEYLKGRAASPYQATSDVVLAYHHDDGLFRIYRAALTDSDRTLRLCESIVSGRFDDVRQDLEEWLINNPALVPTSGGSTNTSIEWAAGSVIDALEQLRTTLHAGMERAPAVADRALQDFARLTATIRSSGHMSPAALDLVSQCRDILEQLHDNVSSNAAMNMPDISGLRRRALSLVEQIVLEFTPN